jgi:hypothetical protein
VTENDWHTSGDPTPMLEFLRGRASDRKLRLFAVENARLVMNWLVDPNSKTAVEASEQVAEGVSTVGLLVQMYTAAWDVVPLATGHLRVCAARAAARTVEEEAYLAALFTTNEIVGFYWELQDIQLEEQEAELVSEDDRCRAYAMGKNQADSLMTNFLRDIFGNPFRPVLLDPAWLSSTVKQLAQTIYEERAFDRLPVLGDALEDAGCTNQDILTHCRQPGIHVRGCWALDLVLAKE